MGRQSDLWSWGDLPAGYTMDGNQIIPGSPFEPGNESIMETPSQLEPDNNPGNMVVGGFSQTGLMAVAHLTIFKRFRAGMIQPIFQLFAEADVGLSYRGGGVHNYKIAWGG